MDMILGYICLFSVLLMGSLHPVRSLQNSLFTKPKTTFTASSITLHPDIGVKPITHTPWSRPPETFLVSELWYKN